ncbi:hypothetical protein ACWEQG_19380 [Microbispora sp. NPDC004025]
MTLLPLALSAFSGGWVSFGFTSYGLPSCPAFDFLTMGFPGPLLASLLWARLLAVPVAFALWLVTRGGPASRVTGQVVACYVLLLALVSPASVAYDVVTAGSVCWELWEPVAGWNLGVSACDVVAAALILSAVRPAGSRPHARLRRTAGVFGVCCLLLAVPAADRGADDRYTGLDVALRLHAATPGTGETTETERLLATIAAAQPAHDEDELSEDDCDPWTVVQRSYGDTEPHDREHAFLCTARGVVPVAQAGHAPRFVTLPDRELLAFGRALCGVAGRPSTEPRVHTLFDQAGLSDWSYSLMNALVFLCPDAVAREAPDLVLTEAEARKKDDDYRAKLTAHCSDPARRLRAVRQATTALIVGEGGGYLVDGGNSAGVPRRLDRAFDEVIDWLTTTAVSVGTAMDNTPICLTVKALPHTPRVRLRGWDTVVETGLASPDGVLGLAGEADGSLPNLAVAGPGYYRVRVYVRGRAEALKYASEWPVEEHLLLVFPGSSGKTLFLRG